MPRDLPRLQPIALHLELQAVRGRIAEVEQSQAAPRTTAARPSAPPEWTLQLDFGADQMPIAVHHGECTVGRARSRRITRQDAIEALAARVEACFMCQPNRELQID
ncbi:DUF6233 domain-containing protein [Streptomyces sp. NPDC093589]|uniref:DUF6233 domain-containing protein n=1 Tax=Streptomyces sp. NPDC093589 TaxID=3366043 RepID=UPI0038075C0B